MQRLSEFDASGKSLKDHWQTIIDDATMRLGTADDNRCRVTVTDRFGGRGHDFRVVDKEANLNGGMLVIATSIPDEREWIQWRGRTARQDRPGQYYVILNTKGRPFVKNKDNPEDTKGKGKAAPAERAVCPARGRRPRPICLTGPPDGSGRFQAHPRAPPEHLGGLPWPQQPASGRPKDEKLPPSTYRQAKSC